MSGPCECLKVAPLGDGTWACIMGDCRRVYVPIEASSTITTTPLTHEAYQRGRQDEREHLRLNITPLLEQHDNEI